MSHNPHRTELGLAIVRVALGATLAAHGSQKLFGWFGGRGIEGTSGGMEAMGFLPAKTSAVLAGLGEAGGGTLLALGLATPVAGSAAASTMLAAGAVHKPAGFFVTKGGFEYAGILGLAGAAMAIGGPGYYSLDRLLGDRLNRPWMAAAALTVFGAASAAVLSRRRRALESPAPTAAEQVEEGMTAEATGTGTAQAAD
jgi:putative oxidoreductase